MSPDRDKRTPGVSLRKVQTGSNVSKSGLVQKPGTECAGVADRMVLSEYELVGGKAPAESQVSRRIGLGSLVEVVAIRQVVVVRQSMIDPDDVVPGSIW